MNTVIFYFSGTGNSKFVAELFAKNMSAQCISIEKDIGFFDIIENTNTIAFSYPIYGSRPPRIIR